MYKAYKSRWAEAVSGILTTFLALVSLVYLLFGPGYSFADSTGTSGTASMLQALQSSHIQPSAIIAFGLLFVGIIGVGVSAVYHSRTQQVIWRNVLWCSVSVIVLFTFIGVLSIGPIIAPSAVFAVFTLYLASK